jgi:hypothetical protein
MGRVGCYFEIHLSLPSFDEKESPILDFQHGLLGIVALILKLARQYLVSSEPSQWIEANSHFEMHLEPLS